jgi:hypothetical protein
MATYEEIHGKRVETFSSDPTLDSTYEGQVWFNSTSGTLKTVVTSDAFISATPMPVAKSTWHRAGTMTAGLFCAGNSSTGFTTSTEEWNGSGFSQGGAIGTALYVNTGFGTQTAGVSAAGRPTNGSSGDTNATFEYDGSTWTSVNAANLAARTRQSFGIQTAGAMVGGFQQTTAAYTNATEEYDGTNWTTVTAAPTNLSGSTCMGTQTAAIVGVGGAPTAVVTMLAYDGTNWTSSPSMNNARSGAGAGGTGATNTAGLVFGGSPYSPTASATAERWDGTSFTNSPASLSTARYGAGIGDGSTNGIMVGGYQGTAFQSAVEEFNSSASTFTAAAWASSGSMNVARDRLAGAGTQTAALGFGSEAPPGAGTAGNKSESYDGTSWTETPTIQTNRDSLAGAGTQTAALAFAGDSQVPPSGGAATTGATEEWNGSSWSEQSDMSTARRLLAGNGTQTAGLAVSGYAPPSNTTAVEEYDGSSWTNGGAVSVARRHLGAAGTQTAGLAFGGYATDDSNATEEYDGSSWTTGGVLNTARNGVYGMGLQTATLASGGSIPSYVTSTEAYDGTAWSTRPNMGTARAYGASGINCPATAGLAFAGTTGSLTAVTEEFTGETTTVSAKTLTTS